MGKYKIGFAAKSITPNSPMQMGGYSGKRISQGVHDPLFVKTVVLQEQKTKKLTIFATYDLIGIDSSIKDEVLKTYSDDTQLILFATHTHSGPAGTVLVENKEVTFSGATNHEYREDLILKTIEAINEGVSDLQEFKYTINNGTIIGAYSNRQDPALYINDQISVLNVDTPNSKALFYHFSCHPTILKPNNRLFSKDLIWGVASQINTDFSLFVNGTAGDISTRFTRISDDYKEVLRTGKIIGDKINELKEDGKAELEKMEIHPFNVTLKTKTPHSKEFLLSEIEKLENKLQNEQDLLSAGEVRLLETKIQGYQIEHMQTDFLKNHTTLVFNCNLMIWDNYVMVTIPGELFSSLAKPLLEKYPNLLFGTYADGSNGYITDTSGYDLNYYESMASLLDKGQGEVLIEKIEKKIEGINYAT